MNKNQKYFQVEVSYGLRFNNYEVTYEVTCDSEAYSVPSMMLFKHSQFQFKMKVSKNHFEKAIVGDIEMLTDIGTYTAKIYPEGPYADMIAGEISPPYPGTSGLKVGLINSITRWRAILLKHLENAIKETEFVELCHYCPKYPWDT